MAEKISTSNEAQTRPASLASQCFMVLAYKAMGVLKQVDPHHNFTPYSNINPMR